MTISVAICTYNGENYIKEQLLSIINQRKKVDEIVLCDDGSTDDTISVVEKIKETYPYIKWTIKQNKQNLGFCDNFAQALSLCNGDIIFLSDQDDIWREDKTEVISLFFEKNKDKDVVFTNGTLIGTKELPPFTLFDIVGFTPDIQKQFDEGWATEFFAYDGHATGATMALRRRILNGWNVSSKYNNKFNIPFHDIQLVFRALSTNGLGYIPDCLIQYRIHNNQTSGFGDWLYNPPVYKRPLYESHFGDFITIEGIDIRTANRLRFYWQRAVLKEHRYGRKIIMNLIEYKKIYEQLWWKPFWSDLMYSLKITFKKKSK